MFEVLIRQDWFSLSSSFTHIGIHPSGSAGFVLMDPTVTAKRAAHVVWNSVLFMSHYRRGSRLFQADSQKSPSLPDQVDGECYHEVDHSPAAPLA